jgi:hypothetical protein
MPVPDKMDLWRSWNWWHILENKRYYLKIQLWLKVRLFVYSCIKPVECHTPRVGCICHSQTGQMSIKITEAWYVCCVSWFLFLNGRFLECFCLCIVCQYFWCLHSSPVGPFGKLCSTYYRLIHGIETCVEADSHSATQVIHAVGIQTLITIRTIRTNRMHCLLSIYFNN